MQGGKTKIESREKVISNIATEERNTINLIPTPTAGILLSQVRTQSRMYRCMKRRDAMCIYARHINMRVKLLLLYCNYNLFM